MKIFTPLYDWVLNLSRHRNATWWLGALSFAESSFFPIPPDVMLAPMALARRSRAFWFALITTVTSVLGGIAGYFIGAFFFDQLAQPLIELYHATDKYEAMKAWFAEKGIWVVLLAGFTPIPYKVFTIAAGALSMAFAPFVLASIVGRGARFFLVAALVYFAGPKFEQGLRRYVDIIGWIMIALIVVGVVIWKFAS